MSIEHTCKVLDYCQFEDTKIFFCIICKKVKGAAKEYQITISMDSEVEMDKYSEEFLKENV